LRPLLPTVQLVRRLKNLGWALYVATARPVNLKRVWSDSQLWLQEQQLAVDKLLLLDNERVLWADQLQRAGHPVLALDDNASLAQRYSRICPVWVTPFGYNQHLEESDRLTKFPRIPYDVQMFVREAERYRAEFLRDVQKGTQP
jgi:hypothetical protein